MCCGLAHWEFVCRDDEIVKAGWARMRGRRSYNEDNVYCKIATMEGNEECGEIVCVGVFDGHGGPKASEYVQGHLFENILSSESFPEDVFKAIEDGFVWTDSKYNKLDERQRNDDGCTATAALIINNSMYVSHVGDSRAVLGQRRKNSDDVIAIPLTDDHKPDRRDERTRIENVGGTVIHAGTWRVSGVLAVSRSFGNRLMKRFIVAHPEIRQDTLSPQTKCLVVASDGLWDVFSNQDAVDAALKYSDAEEAAKEMIKMAYDRGSYDNISCIVCYFDYPDVQEPETSVRAPVRASDTVLSLDVNKHHGY